MKTENLLKFVEAEIKTNFDILWKSDIPQNEEEFKEYQIKTIESKKLLNALKNFEKALKEI